MAAFSSEALAIGDSSLTPRVPKAVALVIHGQELSARHGIDRKTMNAKKTSL
jgi:hypothetical protein